MSPILALINTKNITNSQNFKVCTGKAATSISTLLTSLTMREGGWVREVIDWKHQRRCQAREGSEVRAGEHHIHTVGDKQRRERGQQKIYIYKMREEGKWWRPERWYFDECHPLGEDWRSVIRCGGCEAGDEELQIGRKFSEFPSASSAN